MNLSEDEYHVHSDEYDGYCKVCDDITVFSGVEPDARNYKCPECYGSTVFGIEEAFMQGLIKVE
jgi:Zn finger protein HypA/HybF involved in hydrogenase expression